MSTVFSFEDEIPSCICADENLTISISNKHFKDGQSSLKWDFSNESKLIVNHSIGYTPFIEGSLSNARGTFSLWIYCEKALDGEFQFVFSTKGIENCSFKMNMNFTGWRTVWVQFQRDMQGMPSETMDSLTIKSPIKLCGTVYIDQLILCTPVDPRHPTRDCQVPFVNLQADTSANSHWLSLYKFSLLQKKALENLEVGKECESASDLILERFDEYVMKMKKTFDATEQQMNEFKEQYKNYNISVDNSVIIGRTIDVIHHHDIFPKGKLNELLNLTNPIDIKDCSKYLLDVAYAYHNTNNKQHKQDLLNIFINICKQLLDQGFAYGSSMGTTHHLGYPMRDYFWAVMLMRNPLEKAGILEKMQMAVSWFSGSGRIFREPKDMQGESMDTLNTLAQGILISILLMKNADEKLVCLNAVANWLNHCMLPSPGLRGPFKVDGSSFHHCNHYPAYAMGGFMGITPVIYFLSRTPFAIAQKTHANVKQALLMMRVYCNHTNWLVSMSSRHPVGCGVYSGISSFTPFLLMAMAGSPDKKEEVDLEVASAYLRLTQPLNADVSNFTSIGIKAENAPTGHWNLNYGAAALHRRNNWLAGVRGHSRYIWANETYLNANLYGRYITHGNLQILSKGEPINNTDSGYVQEGWDFNCFPGTTTIHLPLNLLKSDVRNVDIHSGFEEMLLSDETFAGGTNMDKQNGVFAMKLHEHPKYNGSHRARKSYFFFDNRIVCIGTDIENDNNEYMTHTTLFQNHLSIDSNKTFINDENGIAQMDYEKHIVTKDPVWIVDNIGNGYYVYAGQNLSVFRKNQHSKTQNTDIDAYGNFEKAWISHGNAPKDESYQYTILVDTDPVKMQEFANSMKQTPPHTIINANTNSHIVRDNVSNTVAYAFFEPCENIVGGTICGVDTPSLVMEKLCGNTLKLSVCDPDLRLYEGIEKDQYDKDGNRMEVSLYSRTWRSAKSKEATLTISLNGKWSTKDAVCTVEQNKTLIKIPCKDALTANIFLTKL